MSMKMVMLSVLVGALAVSTAFAQSAAPVQIEGKAPKADNPGTPAARSVKPVSAKPIQVLPAKQKTEEQEEYREALDIVSKAKDIGNEEQAFLLYTDALLKLRKIRGEYPDFKAEEVEAKVKEVNSLLKDLEDVKCQSLEDEKAGRFRFLVWKRQILILDRIDKLQEETEKNADILEEIKDKLGI